MIQSSQDLPSRDLKAAIVWSSLCLIWGSTWLFIKVGLEDLPPIGFAGLRFAVAVVPLFVLVLGRKIRPLPNRRDLWLMSWTGLLGIALPYGLVFWGEQHISSGLAALLFATFPLFGLLIAHFRVHTEPLTRARLLGAVVGLLGVGLVFSEELASSSPLALWGSIAVVISAIVAAYADVAIKASGNRLDPLLISLVQMTAGFIPLLTVGVVVEGSPLQYPWTPMALFSVFYLALVGSALAFVLFFWLVQRVAVTTAMLVVLVTPLVAVLLGVVFLHEPLTWRIAFGGFAIVGGVGFALLRTPASAPP
ncbi:MAG: EamA family transporter [Thermoanaerobaculia bacterium]